MVTHGQKEWVNKNLDIETYLNQLGIHVPANGKVFCPFHHNTNTPSAKVFYREEGHSLYCFSERKHYNVFDVMKKAQYDDEDFKSIVPEQYWYTATEKRKEEYSVVPVVHDYLYEKTGGAFGLLSCLDSMWENMSNVQCRRL